jgi:hypothetical protein
VRLCTPRLVLCDHAVCSKADLSLQSPTYGSLSHCFAALFYSYVNLKWDTTEGKPEWLWDANRSTTAGGSGEVLYFVSHAFCNEIDIVIEQLTRRFPPEDHKKTFGAHARAPVPPDAPR